MKCPHLGTCQGRHYPSGQASGGRMSSLTPAERRRCELYINEKHRQAINRPWRMCFMLKTWTMLHQRNRRICKIAYSNASHPKCCLGTPCSEELLQLRLSPCCPPRLRLLFLSTRRQQFSLTSLSVTTLYSILWCLGTWTNMTTRPLFMFAQAVFVAWYIIN